MLIIAFGAGAVLCALQAVRAPRLLQAAFWLAGVSALTSMLLYSLGAREVAVVELSVGAGLVIILFVFAISLAGEPNEAGRALVSPPLAAVAVGLVLVLLVELAWPRIETHAIVLAAPLSTILWQDRQLDVLVQIVLIFCGAITMVGLFADDAIAKTSTSGDVRLRPTTPAGDAPTKLAQLAQPTPLSAFQLVPGREPVAESAA